jgi:hypothetical protein
MAFCCALLPPGRRTSRTCDRMEAADTGDMVAPGCTMLSLMLQMVQGRGSVVEDT